MAAQAWPSSGAADALLLSYLEIWPERARAVFGDPSRLYEYDPTVLRRAGADA